MPRMVRSWYGGERRVRWFAMVWYFNSTDGDGVQSCIDKTKSPPLMSISKDFENMVINWLNRIECSFSGWRSVYALY